MISLSNLLIEAGSMTLLMKNLSHFVPSTSYVLNAGFFLEIIEIIAKLLTIVLLLIGLQMGRNFLHNYLVITFGIAGLILLSSTILIYGKLRIRYKQINDAY